MKEIDRQRIYSKLITDTDVEKEIKSRKSPYITESFLNSKEGSIKDRLNDGWEIDKVFKTKTRLKKLKSHDIYFEDKVWSMFAMLGFHTLNKDRTLELPYKKEGNSHTQQIDIFAKDDETILIVECKSAEKNTLGNFKKDIEAYKGKIEGIIKSISSLYPSKKYKFKFIFATEKYGLSKPDLERIESINGVHFDEESINYYLKMHKQIGLAARYQLLGTLFQGLEIPEIDNRIPAIRGKMGGHTYFSFSIEPEKLLKIGYVLHRNKANSNMMPTYQRIIKKSRLKSVHNFIEDKGYFPNSIIISIDSGKKRNLQFDLADTQVKSAISDVGILHLPKRYRSAYIIDGQHRLYGYANSDYKTTNSIPVVAFLNLNREEQVKLFMDINEKQKAVSKNLRSTLDADLLWTSDSFIEQHKALKSRIAIELGENRNSKLFDEIYTGEDKRKVTIQQIRLALTKSNFLGIVTKNKIEKLGTFYNGDLQKSFEKLSNFLMLTFNYISECLPNKWSEADSIILLNKGIYAFILLQSNIIDLLLSESIINKNDKNQKILDESKKYLDPAINYLKNISIDDENNLKKSYGAAGDVKYWRTLQNEVRNIENSFNPDGLEEYNKKEAKLYNTKAIEIIRELETYFKSDFKEKLQNKYDSLWFKQGVPPQEQDKAHLISVQKNREIENPEDEVSAWDCLTIIAYRKIAIKSGNWRELFEKEYTLPNEEKISGGKEAKTKWMVKLEKIRNENFHSYSVTEDEFEFLQFLFDWKIKNQ